jgi:selenium metabolism protein YedF
MGMKKIDALGKPCPLPVIEAKKAIREMRAIGGEIIILVDNAVAVKNLEKMTEGLNLTITSTNADEHLYTVQITVPQGVSLESKAAGSSLVIAFGKKVMGTGDPALGEILLKSYINSLTELDQAPQQLLFFNEGAFLTNENSTVLKDLQALQTKGTAISTCGACLDFYNLKDSLAIGDITNMYRITEMMAEADKVIMF